MRSDPGSGVFPGPGERRVCCSVGPAPGCLLRHKKTGRMARLLQISQQRGQTMSLRPLRALTLTTLLAGFAFIMMFSPVNGLTPGLAFVAGL